MSKIQAHFCSLFIAPCSMSMTAFNLKKLNSQSNLGETLSQRREELGLSLISCARDINISVKYLECLETGNYKKLPGDVYTRNFLKSYAKRLDLDVDEVVSQYIGEQSDLVQATSCYQIKTTKLQKIWQKFLEWLNPTIVRRLAIISIVLIVLGYLGFKAMAFVETPMLAIESPIDNLQTEQASVIVKGTTEPETNITINEQIINVDDKGTFSKDVALQDGINSIKIVASKGDPNKITTVYRTVVKNGPVLDNSNLNSAPANVNNINK